MENNNKQTDPPSIDYNEQVLITIEKYISLIILEFKEHIHKYNSIFTTMCSNTNDHFDIFRILIEDYCNEINQNQDKLNQVISKLNIINSELPKVEELYNKVKEMRIGLEKMYIEMSKKSK